MSLIDDNDRHQIYLSRLTSGLLKSGVYPSLQEAYKAAKAIINDRGEGSIRRIRGTQAQISKEVDPILQEGLDELTVGLEELALYEVGYAAKLFSEGLSRKLDVPAEDRVKSYIDRSIMTLTSGKSSSSGVWANYVKGNKLTSIKEINGVIAAGYQQGLTTGQMNRQLKNKFNTLIADRVQSLSRTGQSHYQSQAREAMAADNLDIIKYRVFTATFDNRTTMQCRGFHGNAYKMTSKAYPRLPLHYNERSTYVFVESLEQAEEGFRLAIGGKGGEPDGDRDLRYKGKKDQDIFKLGKIPTGKTQTEWLKSNPIWFQNSAIGETRAKLMREGGLTVDMFTDNTGRTLTLNELKLLDKKAFERAGL